MISSLIPTRVHGIIDYLVGLLLIAAPWVLGFFDNHPATMVPVALGIGTIVYSLVTNYEVGLFHVLPMNFHLWIDMLAGLVLATSPWLFHFSNRIMWPHVTFGLAEILIVLMSSSIPSNIPPDSSANNSDVGTAEVV